MVSKAKKMALKHAQITYQDISTNDAEYVKLGPFSLELNVDN